MLQRSHNLLKEASKRHEVLLVSLVQRKIHASQSAVEEAKSALAEFCSHVEAFWIPSESSRLRRMILIAGTFFRSQCYYVNWLRSRTFASCLARLAAAQRFDLIHLDTIGLFPYSAHFRSAPIVLNHHNIESHLLEQRSKQERNIPKRLYLSREAAKTAVLESRACPSCSMNLVVSDLDGQRLKLRAEHARIATVDNGVDTDFFYPSAPVGHGSGGLIFAGGLDWFPNTDAIMFFLKEIWPRLLADNPARVMTVIGKNPPRELLAAAREGPLRVLGYVDDVRPHLEGASIYVCPIRIGGGTRLKILDAMSMAKPIVATELAVEGLDLVPGEHYMRAESPGDFVTCVRTLEADGPLRKRLANACRSAAVNRFSWRAIGEKLDRAYRTAVERRPTMPEVNCNA